MNSNAVTRCGIEVGSGVKHILVHPVALLKLAVPLCGKAGSYTERYDTFTSGDCPKCWKLLTFLFPREERHFGHGGH